MRSQWRPVSVNATGRGHSLAEDIGVRPLAARGTLLHLPTEIVPEFRGYVVPRRSITVRPDAVDAAHPLS